MANTLLEQQKQKEKMVTIESDVDLVSSNIGLANKQLRVRTNILNILKLPAFLHNFVEVM